MTISEIAKMANVSSAAVSRYLNNGSLSDDKRARIEKIIKETGYVPSSSARAMRTGARKTIGAIVPSISSESVARIIAGVTDTLEGHGYEMILANTNNDIKKEIEYIEHMAREQVAGIIFMATIITPPLKKLIQTLTIPVVVVGQRFEGHSCVFFNDYQAAYEMANELLRKKCKGFAYLGVTDKDLAAGKARHDGVRTALTEHKISNEKIVEVETGFKMLMGNEAMELALKKNPDINQVFCATDSIAVGAMLYLRKIGKKVPEDIRITGIGHNQKSDVIQPELTTVEYHYKTCGIEAGRMMMEQLDEEQGKRKKLELDAECIIRDSTK